MILTGAKNPGKLFEEPAGAGWVRVERGVRPRGGGGTLRTRPSRIGPELNEELGLIAEDGA